jgi:hypothetical protein
VNGASERADAIEARGKRNHAVHTDAAKSWLESNDTAKRSGDAEGAAGVAANAAIAETGSNGGSRPAAGAAGDS